METVLAVGTLLTAVGTLALAFATFSHAKKTKDISNQNRALVTINNATLEETKEMVAANQRIVETNQRMVDINNSTLEEIRVEREARERPHVIVYVDYDHLPMLYIVVENVGGSTAARVSFIFRGGLIRPAMERYEEEPFDLPRELRMFQGGYGLRLLPAGEKLSLWWGHAEAVVQGFRYNDPGVEVEIHYSSLTKEKYPREDKDYRDEFILNPVDVWKANRTAVRLRPSLNEIVFPLIQIAEKIGKAVDGYGNVKIKTATERAREQAARTRELRRMLKRSAEARKETEAASEDHDEEVR